MEDDTVTGNDWPEIFKYPNIAESEALQLAASRSLSLEQVGLESSFRNRIELTRLKAQYRNARRSGQGFNIVS